MPLRSAYLFPLGLDSSPTAVMTNHALIRLAASTHRAWSKPEQQNERNPGVNR
jgi:hypothetical protein